MITMERMVVKRAMIASTENNSGVIMPSFRPMAAIINSTAPRLFMASPTVKDSLKLIPA